ncbi:hypothetical protein Scep_016804 [Stephania cephalantha]|uniref:Adipocyte plasma membrane-associated protein n=1 Tax=Stephania cephalantha TaxID=152367 RepID=A0AAP0IQ68_9MAGN
MRGDREREKWNQRERRRQKERERSGAGKEQGAPARSQQREGGSRRSSSSSGRTTRHCEGRGRTAAAVATSQDRRRGRRRAETDDAEAAWGGAGVDGLCLGKRRDLCDGSNEPGMEYMCGRPLGLQFNKQTFDLYIADAYYGLLKVTRNGGVATWLASSADNLPFKFTNIVDINPRTDVVYFTDRSIFFPRWCTTLAYITSCVLNLCLILYS